MKTWVFVLLAAMAISYEASLWYQQPAADEFDPNKVVVDEAAKKGRGQCKVYPRMTKQTFPPQPGSGRVFTAEQLKMYDGNNCKLPLLIAIVGEVYDVGPGKKYYDPGGGYSGFAGRDASRAFVTGEFNKTEVRADMDDLTPEQIAAVFDWRQFYRDHKPEKAGMGRYRFVGLLEGMFYDRSGNPKDALTSVEAKHGEWKAHNDVKTAFEKIFKGCNSRTESKNEYFEIWCDDGYHGTGTGPMHVHYTFPSRPDLDPQSKCVCVQPEEAEQMQKSKTANGKPIAGVNFRFVRYTDCAHGTGFAGSKCRRPKGAAAPQ